MLAFMLVYGAPPPIFGFSVLGAKNTPGFCVPCLSSLFPFLSVLLLLQLPFCELPFGVLKEEMFTIGGLDAWFGGQGGSHLPSTRTPGNHHQLRVN